MPQPPDDREAARANPEDQQSFRRTPSWTDFDLRHRLHERPADPRQQAICIRGGPALFDALSKLGTLTPVQSPAVKFLVSPDFDKDTARKSSLHQPAQVPAPLTVSVASQGFVTPGQNRAPPTTKDPKDDKPRKRVHANKQQLEYLENAFRQCRKPTSKMRMEICKAVGINGRSIQIWFQNRRAREKKMLLGQTMPSRTPLEAVNARGVTCSANDSDAPKPCRALSMTPEAHQASATRSGSFSPASASETSAGTTTQNSPVRTLDKKPLRTARQLSKLMLIGASSIFVGSWCRISDVPGDLVCELNLNEAILRWTVKEGGFSFRMDIPLGSVEDLAIDHVDVDNSAMTITLLAPPFFSKEIRISPVTNDSNASKPTLTS
ncbi:hypothetical protein HK405_011215, partial [Cladochytrium tenue]